MKVLLVSHGVFPELIGGMERHTYYLAKYLTQAGIDITLAIPEELKSETIFPFKIKRFKCGSGPWLWGQYQFSKKISEHLKVHSYDLAFAQGYGLWAYLKVRQIPCVFHPHGLEMFGENQSGFEKVKLSIFRKITHFMVQYADVTVSLGGQITQILKTKLKLEERKIVEIPNGIDWGNHKFQESKKHKSILFVGRFAFNKGIDMLLDALKSIQRKDFSLTFAGSGPMLGSIEDAVSKDSRLALYERPSDEVLMRLYEEHEAFIFTSRFEGMPTVILEAMRAGCFVMATHIGAVSTMVNKQTGLLIKPQMIEIRLALETYLEMDIDEIEQVRKSAYKFVEKNFSWHNLIPSYVKLFSRLIDVKK